MKKAFTLIELVIALGMSAIVFVVVSSLVVMILSTNTKARRQEVFEQTKNDLVVELINNVRWGKQVDVTDNGETDTLTVDSVVYRLEDGRVTKNGEPISPQSVEITSFDIGDYSAQDGLAGLEIKLGMRDRSFSLLTDTLEVAVAQRRTQTGGQI